MAIFSFSRATCSFSLAIRSWVSARPCAVTAAFRREAEALEHRLREHGAGRNRLLDGAGLEGELDGFALEQPGEFGVAHFVDADLLLALEPA
ncbi:MAG: hypothetical protein ACKO3G_10110, partial [Planctomycetaceae bacterium]